MYVLAQYGCAAPCMGNYLALKSHTHAGFVFITAAEKPALTRLAENAEKEDDEED